jgi:two-component system response regulator NreC
MRIVIADDHTLFREGVAKLLSHENSIHVVGEAANGNDAVARCSELHPDILIIDISMPGLSPFEATRQIKKARPETKVLFLSMFDDEDYLTQALESGASGYLVKDVPARQLMAAVCEIARGGTYLSPKMLSRLVDDFRGRLKQPAKVSRYSTLTPREGEVLKFLAEGQTVKDIACDLALSVKTVEAHKFNLMRKLDIHNKAQLVHYAVQKKIVHVMELV